MWGLESHRSTILFTIITCFLLAILYASYLEIENSFKFLKGLRNAYYSLINPLREGLNSFQSDFETRLTTREEIQTLREELYTTQVELLKYKNTFNELKIVKKRKRNSRKNSPI